MSKSARGGSKPVQRTAFDDACRSLARRRLTESEVGQRLLKRHSKADTDEALQKLKEYRFIDDDALIADYVRDRLKLSPRSARLIQVELSRRGIAPEDFRRIFEAEFPEYDEMEVARRALQTKMKSITKYPPQGRRERALRFLAGRGFSYETISEVWDWCCRDTSLSEDDDHTIGDNQ